MNKPQKVRRAPRPASAANPAEVAALQDLLTYALTGLSLVAVEGRKVGIDNHDIDRFICGALFSTLTNVNFDPERFAALLRQSTKYRDALLAEIKDAGGNIAFRA